MASRTMKTTTYILLTASLLATTNAATPSEDGVVDLTNLANYANQETPDYIARDNTPNNNQITDLAPLIAMLKEDLEGEKRFAPYLQIYLRGNPLRSDEAKAQLREMKELKLRVKDMWN